MKKAMLVAALMGTIIAGSVMAGWQPVSFTSQAGDYVYYQVSTKLAQDFFTILKNVGGNRVYITFEDVGYQEFVNSVVSWKTYKRPTPTMGTEAMSAIGLTDGVIGNTAGDITVGVYLADRFVRNGHRPKMSVVVMPQPASNGHSGSSPKVTVFANNCEVSGVKVIYSPRPFNGSEQLAPVGTVEVTTGDQETGSNYAFGKNVGNVGTIHVQGGLFGNSSIRGNIGTLLSEARVCTVKPQGIPVRVLQGGTIGGYLITAGGKIGRISARNGLVMAGGDTAKNRICSGYNAISKYYSATADIGQIIVKRGWDKPCVIAGSDYDAQIAKNAPTFYNGAIKIFRINNKGDGSCQTQTGGYFTSALGPRVLGKKKTDIAGNMIHVQQYGKVELSTFVK